jgi:hypothetical protein
MPFPCFLKSSFGCSPPPVVIRGLHAPFGQSLPWGSGPCLFSFVFCVISAISRLRPQPPNFIRLWHPRICPFSFSFYLFFNSHLRLPVVVAFRPFALLWYFLWSMAPPANFQYENYALTTMPLSISRYAAVSLGIIGSGSIGALPKV